MTASLFAVGYDSADLVEFFKEDLNAIMNGEFVMELFIAYGLLNAMLIFFMISR